MTVCNIRECGARGDGKAKDTPAIQTALDAVRRAGGGTVRVPPGDFLCGALQIGDNTTLLLENGAVLRASRDPADYGAADGQPGKKHLLNASGARSVMLAGNGAVLGWGEADGPDTEKPPFRVGLLLFDKCSDVRVRDVSFMFSPTWTLHLRQCERVWIDGIAILNNPWSRNSDGIDPDACRDVHISNCHIVAGDDCIVFKTTVPSPCENAVVTNCTLETTCTALKLGTESKGDFRNIRMSNCVIRNSSTGIGLFMKDGAVMEDVSFSNISIEDREGDPKKPFSCPIFMDIERRHEDSEAGAIRDVSFSNISARSAVGAVVQGMPESAIRNIALRDVHLRMDAPYDYSLRKKRVAGRRTTSDERDTLYVQRPSCFTFAHVEGLFVDNLHADIAPEVFASAPKAALWLEHVDGAHVGHVVRQPKNGPMRAVETRECGEGMAVGGA